MPWDPGTYNKFKEERHQPFHDLISHIQPKPGMKLLDLGCGTGELTKIAADKFSVAEALGIDNSVEMLHKALHQDNLSFANISIQQQLDQDDKWDVIIANASLQWVENHEVLFPNIISKLEEGGQLAIQMPSQKENVLNQLLYKLVHEEPYHEILADVIRHSPVLSLDEYTNLLIRNGAKNLLVYQKVYPIIAQSVDVLYDFISGSALIPYTEKLQGPTRTAFEEEFKKRIDAAFTDIPKIYAFKRIFLVASF